MARKRGVRRTPAMVEQRMVKLVDDANWQRLIRIGRERGALTIDDLRTALPVELMTPEELADAVMRLEDAGVPVELDEWLARPARGRLADEPAGRDERGTGDAAERGPAAIAVIAVLVVVAALLLSVA
jgi:Sigma-70 factor, region 1.1